MIERKFSKEQVESGKKLSEKEFDEALVKCSECEVKQTRHVIQDCDNCCGTPCWHEKGKGKNKKLLCCDCWAKVNPESENKQPYEYWKSGVSDSELLKELGRRIKLGRIKIDWTEAYENYNEEDDIQGLYTDNSYLSLIWDDEKKPWKERQPLYEFFPSQAERKNKKPSSWRKTVMKDWTKEQRDFFDKEMEQVKNQPKYTYWMPIEKDGGFDFTKTWEKAGSLKTKNLFPTKEEIDKYMKENKTDYNIMENKEIEQKLTNCSRCGTNPWKQGCYALWGKSPKDLLHNQDEDNGYICSQCSFKTSIRNNNYTLAEKYNQCPIYGSKNLSGYSFTVNKDNKKEENE